MSGGGANDFTALNVPDKPAGSISDLLGSLGLAGNGSGMSYPTAPTSVTYPAGLPGQIDAISEQLAAGGYGNVQANRSHLNNIHRPSSLNALIMGQPAAGPARSGQAATPMQGAGTAGGMLGTPYDQWGQGTFADPRGVGSPSTQWGASPEEVRAALAKAGLGGLLGV